MTNEELVNRMIDAVVSHTVIGQAIEHRSYKGTPGARDYHIANDGAVLNGRPTALTDLRERQRELWANVERYAEELHRRLAMSPEERDAECCGLTIDQYRRAVATVTSGL